jgi:nitrogen fixation protein NifU and related proteins
MSELDQLYQAAIVDHDRNPRNHGPLAGATHDATVDNPLCGDVVTVHLRVAGDAIGEAAFEGRGCALSRAAASMMTVAVRDRSVAGARALAAAFEAFVHGAPEAAIPAELGELAAFAGVRRFRARRVCAALAFRALAGALDRG